MRIWFLMTVVLVCGVAQASEWVSVVSSVDNAVQVEIDISSIHVDGQIRRAWFKTRFLPHTQKGIGPDEGKWENNQVSRVEFNCKDELSRADALTVYYEDGSNMSVPSTMYPTPWDPVRPDTLLHGQMDFTCAWKPK